MQRLRDIHLCLGCIFAPMLVFFAMSGIWQTFSLHYGNADNSRALALASTIHTGRGLKTGNLSTLSSDWMRWFVVAMAVCFIATTLLGVVMALRHGKSRHTAVICLAAGIVIPAVLLLAGLFV
ncbi:MAG TPA: hypothetical protein PKA41_10880 [Verrucomicrobiota bacterium]|nr:hypothetical protein [Verrucomicrobiota bacterium]